MHLFFCQFHEKSNSEKKIREINSHWHDFINVLVIRTSYSEKWKIYFHQFLLWKSRKFTLTGSFFREINYLLITLVKPILSRNFCQRGMRAGVNFYNFHNNVQNENSRRSVLFQKISCNHHLQITKLISRKIMFIRGDNKNLTMVGCVNKSASHWISNFFFSTANVFVSLKLR